MKKILLFFLPISILGMILGSNDPVVSLFSGTWLEKALYSLSSSNSILFNLSCGYIISVFFWYLLVEIPESNQRGIIRDNMSQRYISFKKSTICNMLYASGDVGVDYELVDELLDHKKFREYFSGKNKQRWYDVLNGLDENERHIKDVHNDLELLYNDVSYVLNNIRFTNKKSHSLFVNLQENIFRLLNYNDCHYDHVRALSSFLFTMFALWSLVDGDMDEDVVQKMIDQI